ncbi:DUF4013 domain-containing protein [Haloarculaceae archaeon H-GB2-1]|nr:DUF4013 domain-containing protein [Haloarculaceae archaeon H-GB2-1]
MGALMGGVGIGVVLLLFVVSLLVGVFTLGYNVRVLRTTAEGDDELPSFADLGGLFVDGLAGVVINVLYFLPMIALIAVGALAEVNAIAYLGLLWVFPAGYLLPIALSAYASGDFTASFSLGRIVSLATSGGYVKAWLLAFGLYLVFGIVNVVLSFIPLLGTFVTVFVGVYATLVAFRLYGLGVTEAANTVSSTSTL